ncbi:MAG: hypothetical protein ACFFDB_02550 [Promethearchaeota archaeon]
MSELKIECYSCGFERIIDEREFVEDIQQCPSCGSDNIEIVPTGKESLERQFNPEEREQIAQRRMIIIGILGTIFLLCAIVLYRLNGVLLSPSFFILLALTLGIIGVLLLIIAVSWFTSGQCLCAGCG